MCGVSLHFQVAFCGFDAGVFRALCAFKLMDP